MNIDEIYDRFRWLSKGNLAGAPHPDLFGGIKSLSALLRSQGIGAIVTLCEEPLTDDPADFAFDHLNAPTPNLRSPRNLQEIITFIDNHNKMGTGVLVHCFAGIGRTGTALTAWLLSHNPGLSADDAIASIKKNYIPEYAQDLFPEHQAQREALEEFAAARKQT